MRQLGMRLLQGLGMRPKKPVYWVLSLTAGGVVSNVHIDDAGYVYAMNPGNQRTHKFDQSGTVYWTKPWGSTSYGAVQYNKPLTLRGPPGYATWFASEYISHPYASMGCYSSVNGGVQYRCDLSSYPPAYGDTARYGPAPFKAVWLEPDNRYVMFASYAFIIEFTNEITDWLYFLNTTASVKRIGTVSPNTMTVRFYDCDYGNEKERYFVWGDFSGINPRRVALTKWNGPARTAGIVPWNNTSGSHAWSKSFALASPLDWTHVAFKVGSSGNIFLAVQYTTGTYIYRFAPDGSIVWVKFCSGFGDGTNPLYLTVRRDAAAEPVYIACGTRVACLSGADGSVLWGQTWTDVGDLWTDRQGSLYCGRVKVPGDGSKTGTFTLPVGSFAISNTTTTVTAPTITVTAETNIISDTTNQESWFSSGGDVSLVFDNSAPVVGAIDISMTMI